MELGGRGNWRLFWNDVARLDIVNDIILLMARLLFILVLFLFFFFLLFLGLTMNKHGLIEVILSQLAS